MTILELYLDYTDNVEGPQSFKVWSMLSCIAALLGRKTWISRGTWNCYPNLYVVLCGPSGKVKKSSSVDAAVHLVKRANPEMVIASQKITPEALIQVMSNAVKEIEVPWVFIKAREFKVFLNADDSTVALLTDLFDCPEGEWSYHTRSRGIECVEDPCLNLLAGSTPDWLSDGLPKGSVGGGFTSRLVMVHEREVERRIAHPTVNPELGTEIVDRLKEIHFIEPGEFDFPQESQDIFEDWYTTIFDKFLDDEDLLGGYFGRKDTMVLKVGMLLALSERPVLRLEPQHLEAALTLLSALEERLPDLLKMAQLTEEARTTHLVRETIKRIGRVPHSNLLTRYSYRASSSAVAESIQTLILEGCISTRRELSERGKEIQVYYWEGG